MNSTWNNSRLRPEDPNGFYESYFQRANHPSRPLAFWIRYTAFSPRGRPDEARGELWAIYFDGETGRNTAVKDAFPLSDCNFSPTQLEVHIGAAKLTNSMLSGRAVSTSHALHWTLDYAGHEPPLLLLPEHLYERGFPKAKALVGTPNAVYTGTLIVDGEEISIDGGEVARITTGVNGTRIITHGARLQASTMPQTPSSSVPQPSLNSGLFGLPG